MSVSLKKYYRGFWARLAGLFLRPSPERFLIVIGHMRSGSSVLSNILISHPDVLGIGETFVVWGEPHACDRYAYQVLKHRRWVRARHWFFDKILHNHLLGPDHPLIGQAKFIFLTRRPEETVASVHRLWVELLGMDKTIEEADAYYVERLEGMARLWDAVAPERRMALDYAEFDNPQALVERLSAFMRFDVPLSSDYNVFSFTGKPGIGDPSPAIRAGKLEKKENVHQDVSSAPAKAAYEAFRKKIGQG